MREYARLAPDVAAQVSREDWMRLRSERCPACGESIGKHQITGLSGRYPKVTCPNGWVAPQDFGQRVMAYYDVGFARPAELGESGRGGTRARSWHEGSGLSPKTVGWMREVESREGEWASRERGWHRDQQARYEAALDAEIEARREWESIAGYSNRMELGEPGYDEWKAREVAARRRWDEAKTRTAVASRAPGVRKLRRR